STLPIALAGKTGTAQIGGTDTTHAWFTSFGPYDDPQAVVTVLLEKGGAGDTDAVPLAKSIWQWMLEHPMQ
ncbi:MAG: peptidoglycan glycosyltransferase, partial [Candidatus Andersenbacteria bacterium]|nr:peptidoglycan glycosyltransferase [Candidatus Andersenbacteria bacterium]